MKTGPQALVSSVILQSYNTKNYNPYIFKKVSGIFDYLRLSLPIFRTNPHSLKNWGYLIASMHLSIMLSPLKLLDRI